MGKDDIHMYRRNIGIGSMVSEHSAGNPTTGIDVLCGIHVHMDRDQLELRVPGSGVYNKLLAIAEN